MKIKVDEKMLTQNILKEALDIHEKAVSKASKNSKILLSETYDYIIDQYYLYKTTSYYRHGTGVGTGTGINFYRSNCIRETPNKKGIIIDINADAMQGYPRVSKDYVLDNFYEKGIRGIELGGSSLNGKFMFFHDEFVAMIDGSFRGYSMVNVGSRGKITGTPQQVMNEMGKRITETYFQYWWWNEWKETVKTGKYKYF